MSKSRRRRLTAEMLESLIGELQKVRDMLPASYMTIEDEDVEAGQIQAEEIEVALTAIVSSLSKQWEMPTEPDSLSDFLASLFSSDDDLVSIAMNLEDAVNGYFGDLFGENLDLADNYFADLISVLKERRERWKQTKG